MAGTYVGCAQFLQKENAFLEKTEAILLQYRNCTAFQPEQKRRINIIVVWELKKPYSIWGKKSEEEKCDKVFYQITLEQERKIILDSLKNVRWIE